MSKVKAGHLYLLVRCNNPAMMHHNGTIRAAASPSKVHKGAWYMDPPVYATDGLRGSWCEEDLIPINDNPGNEKFVVDARNKLKGKTEITAKGELA